jgi:hypothetical protein
LNIVLDANILADYLLTFRPRHKAAVDLFQRLENRKYTLHMPAHAYLELFSTVISEWRTDPDKVVLKKLFHPRTGRPIEVVDINLKFVMNHLIRPMPQLKGGDLPYALLSIRNGMLLITEDLKLKRETNRCGGKAASILEAGSLLVNEPAGS